MRQTMRFLKEFVTRPTSTGAIAPSSKYLANRMVEWIDWSQAQRVVEYGPGNGSFTGKIVEHLPAGAKFFAVELNHNLAVQFRQQFPTVKLYEECVSNIARLCEQEGMDQLDCVVSGLPWAGFNEELQTRLFEPMLKILKPGGQFVTFAYYNGVLLPAGQRFRRRLKASFTEVTTSSGVWMNLPPAFVYRCRK